MRRNALYLGQQRKEIYQKYYVYVTLLPPELILGFPMFPLPLSTKKISSSSLTTHHFITSQSRRVCLNNNAISVISFVLLGRYYMTTSRAFFVYKIRIVIFFFHLISPARGGCLQFSIFCIRGLVLSSIFCSPKNLR